MHNHKRRSEGVLYTAPSTRSRLHIEVRDELAGTETFLTDTQRHKIAQENPDGIHQNASVLYIAGTKSGRDVYDEQTQRYEDVDKFMQDGFIEIDGKQTLEFLIL